MTPPLASPEKGLRDVLGMQAVTKEEGSMDMMATMCAIKAETH